MIALAFVHTVFDNCMYINLMLKVVHLQKQSVEFFSKIKKSKTIVNNFYYVLKCVILLIH